MPNSEYKEEEEEEEEDSQERRFRRSASTLSVDIRGSMSPSPNNPRLTLTRQSLAFAEQAGDLDSLELLAAEDTLFSEFWTDDFSVSTPKPTRKTFTFTSNPISSDSNSPTSVTGQPLSPLSQCTSGQNKSQLERLKEASKNTLTQRKYLALSFGDYTPTPRAKSNSERYGEIEIPKGMIPSVTEAILNSVYAGDYIELQYRQQLKELEDRDVFEIFPVCLTPLQNDIVSLRNKDLHQQAILGNSEENQNWSNFTKEEKPNSEPGPQLRQTQLNIIKPLNRALSEAFENEIETYRVKNSNSKTAPLWEALNEMINFSPNFDYGPVLTFLAAMTRKCGSGDSLRTMMAKTMRSMASRNEPEIDSDDYDEKAAQETPENAIPRLYKHLLKQERQTQLGDDESDESKNLQFEKPGPGVYFLLRNQFIDEYNIELPIPAPNSSRAEKELQILQSLHDEMIATHNDLVNKTNRQSIAITEKHRAHTLRKELQSTRNQIYQEFTGLIEKLQLTTPNQDKQEGIEEKIQETGPTPPAWSYHSNELMQLFQDYSESNLNLITQYEEKLHKLHHVGQHRPSNEDFRNLHRKIAKLAETTTLPDDYRKEHLVTYLVFADKLLLECEDTKLFLENLNDLKNSQENLSNYTLDTIDNQFLCPLLDRRISTQDEILNRLPSLSAQKLRQFFSIFPNAEEFSTNPTVQDSYIKAQETILNSLDPSNQQKIDDFFLAFQSAKDFSDNRSIRRLYNQAHNYLQSELQITKLENIADSLTTTQSLIHELKNFIDDNSITEGAQAQLVATKENILNQISLDISQLLQLTPNQDNPGVIEEKGEEGTANNKYFPCYVLSHFNNLKFLSQDNAFLEPIQINQTYEEAQANLHLIITRLNISEKANEFATDLDNKLAKLTEIMAALEKHTAEDTHRGYAASFFALQHNTTARKKIISFHSECDVTLKDLQKQRARISPAILSEDLAKYLMAAENLTTALNGTDLDDISQLLGQLGNLSIKISRHKTMIKDHGNQNRPLDHDLHIQKLFGELNDANTCILNFIMYKLQNKPETGCQMANSFFSVFPSAQSFSAKKLVQKHYDSIHTQYKIESIIPPDVQTVNTHDAPASYTCKYTKPNELLFFIDLDKERKRTTEAITTLNNSISSTSNENQTDDNQETSNERGTFDKIWDWIRECFGGGCSQSRLDKGLEIAEELTSPSLTAS